MIGGASTASAGSKRRHVGKVGEAFDGMDQKMREFFNTPASADVATIKRLASIELGDDRESVVTAGRSLGLTETVADASDTLWQRSHVRTGIRDSWFGVTPTGFISCFYLRESTADQDDRFFLRSTLPPSFLKRYQLQASNLEPIERRTVSPVQIRDDRRTLQSESEGYRYEFCT